MNGSDVPVVSDVNSCNATYAIPGLQNVTITCPDDDASVVLYKKSEYMTSIVTEVTDLLSANGEVNFMDYNNTSSDIAPERVLEKTDSLNSHNIMIMACLKGILYSIIYFSKLTNSCPETKYCYSICLFFIFINSN